MESNFDKMRSTKKRRGFDEDKAAEKRLTKQRRKERKQKREVVEDADSD